jgi:hypothetical protein
MARAQGFARGDFDTSFPIDDKFLAMRNALPPERYYAATGVYWHIAAAAWREVERKPALRICPDAEQEIADLVAHKLLESDTTLKRRAFAAYIGRAKRQRSSASDRKRRNREGMSRGVTRDGASVTGVSQPVTVLARDRVGRGKEGSTSSSSEGGVGETATRSGYPEPGADRDSQDRYHELTGFRPWGQWSGKTLLGAERDYGRSAVEAALDAENAAGANRDDLLKRTLARLARDADRVRQEAAEKPRPKAPKVDQAARDAARRAVLVEAGMLKPGGSS